MKLEYDDLGTGPVITLLHGFPLDRTMWQEQRADLSAGYRLVLPDLRGHGTSGVPEGSYTIDQMADDLIETLDAAGIVEPIVLGGLSLGGYVALSFAVRYPARLRGLMILNSRASSDSPEAAKSREELAQQVERDGNVEAVVNAMVPKLLAPSVYNDRPDLVARLRERMMGASPLGVVGTLRALASRPDRTAQLAEIPCRTLVLTGRSDQLIPLEESTRMATTLKDSSLSIIENAGHLTPLENPPETNQAILDFLESLA